MKTKYKYVHFHRLSSSCWICHRNDMKETIGFLQRYGRIKDWYFGIFGSEWNVHVIKRYINYFRDIADFLGQLNK